MAAANPEVEFHMNGFLNECVEMLNEHYDSKFPNLAVAQRSKSKRVVNTTKFIRMPANTTRAFGSSSVKRTA